MSDYYCVLCARFHPQREHDCDRRAESNDPEECNCFPHTPDEPCTCDGCWCCAGRQIGCTCDINWGCDHT